MGYSRWDDTQYTAYAASTGRATMTKDELFSKRRSIHEKLDPKNVKVGKGERTGMQLRESIISEDNPNPTPIILALDVTGSMGDIAGYIARDVLPKLMTEIHSTSVVTDPHVMFMGFDDVHVVGERALQVSYFEPDLKIVEQLNNMWLVNVGGGNNSESYDLPWYFAGKHTYLEGFEKQGRKGFLFTFGDEPAPVDVNTPQELASVFGGRASNYEPATPEACLKMAQEKFQVFHICIEGGSRSMRRGWTDMLGNNALWLQRNQYEHITDVVLATMAIANGADMKAVIAESKHPEILRAAFENSLNG